MSRRSAFRIESLLAARLALCPHILRDRVVFVSDLTGRLALYWMPLAGGEPRPLLPPGIALQNPALTYGASLYVVIPGSDQILVAIDDHGDEHYQPHLIPLDGGEPELLFAGEAPAEAMLPIGLNSATNTAYFHASDHRRTRQEILAVHLESRRVDCVASAPSLAHWVAHDPEDSVVVTGDQIAWGDEVLYRYDRCSHQRCLLAGLPPEERGAAYRILSMKKPHPIGGGGSLFMSSTAFSETYSPCLLGMTDGSFRDVRVLGLDHAGCGELHRLEHVFGDSYFLEYNIDGCSHGYVGTLDAEAAEFRIRHRLCDEGRFDGGVLHSFHFAQTEAGEVQAVLSFSTATSPVQLYHVVFGEERKVRHLTQERIPGIDEDELSPGEDASFESFDGLRVSARLYRPAPKLGFQGRRPLVLWIHGGPESQERPDFSWFSMPLIQYLTLNGFAVFVPNVRGSMGYGVRYMRLVHRDWGGQDLLDHVSGLQSLERDERIDSSRRGAAGRSYGGFMTMCLMSRHPGLLRAGADLFGLCDLVGFADGMPDNVREFIRRNVGDPAIEHERERLRECSPTTHFARIQGAVLFVQGTRDPRALPHLTFQYADSLRGMGKDVQVLAFEDEGHDVIKSRNKAFCYQRIADFFEQHLGPLS